MLAGDELEHNFKTIECEPETSSIRHTVSTWRAEAPVCVQTAPGDGEAMARDVTGATADEERTRNRPTVPTPDLVSMFLIFQKTAPARICGFWDARKQ